MAPPPVPFDNADDKLKTQQYLQQLMQAQEEANSAKTAADESDQLAAHQLNRMQNSVADQLELLIQQGLLTPEQTEAILSEHSENEEKLKRKMDIQKERLKAKLAARRNNKLSQLREAQEKEKNAVSVKSFLSEINVSSRSVVHTGTPGGQP